MNGGKKMGAEKRNYSYLKKHMSQEEFKTFCKKVANQYAKSDDHFSSSYFVKTENITKSCFYRVIEEAVVRNWISEEIVNKVEAKSISNQKYHAQNAGETTLRKYAELRRKRNEYIFSLYSDEEIRNIAKEFAERPVSSYIVNEIEFAERKENISKRDFAKKYDLNIVVLDALLKKAFVENIADDEICKTIERRSLQRDSSKRTVEFFQYLWSKRRCPN